MLTREFPGQLIQFSHTGSIYGRSVTLSDVSSAISGNHTGYHLAWVSQSYTHLLKCYELYLTSPPP